MSKKYMIRLIMKYFWNMVTGDLVETDDKHVISLLLADGYVEVSRERYAILADAIPG